MPAETALLFSSRPAGKLLTLRPGDVMSLRVLGHSELSAEVEVDGDGKVSLPFTDDVRAAGLSVKELQEEIKLRLEKYIVKPQISLRVVKFQMEPVKVYAQYDAQGRRIRVFTSPMHFESFKAWTLNLEVSSSTADEIEFAFSPLFRDAAGKYELRVTLDERESLFLGNAANQTEEMRPFGGEEFSKNKVRIPLKTLARIAAARKVEVSLSHQRFLLREDDLEALRFMVRYLGFVS